MLPKPYKYKKKKRGVQKQNLNRLKHDPVDEGLTGFVKRQEASALEERFARALNKQKLEYHFQVVVPTGYQIPGQLNTVDFLIVAGIGYPIEVDGDWVHKSSSQKRQDALRDAIIDTQMASQGWQPIRRIPGYELETQDDADRIVKELF